MSKLLVHRIPAAVHSQELHKVIPGDFTVEVKVRRILCFSHLISMMNDIRITCLSEPVSNWYDMGIHALC